MKIVVDENMPLVRQLFASFGDIVALPGRQMTAADIQDADVLLVRSVTSVNAALLAQAHQLKFIGTATIGTDHVDQSYVAERGIPFFSAPGCNKISVGEFVISALLILAERRQITLAGLSLGIIGAGNTGTAVAERAAALGMQVRLHDPFKQMAGDPREFCSYETALACDVISFHVPMTKSGPHPTFHMLDAARINALSSSQLIVNASRGAVWDNQAMLARQQSADPLTLIMDVWEHEPDVLLPLVPHTQLATPHIAGYSLEGKYRGTYMLYQAFCQVFGYPCSLELHNLLPESDISEVTIHGSLTEARIRKLVHLVYDVRRDDARFRQRIGPAGAFDLMRKQYPERREWSSLTVRTDDADSSRLLSQLGFTVLHDSVSPGE